MPHPLHVKVGKSISKIINPPLKLVKDSACGGKQHIPLFLEKDKSRATQVCKVDLLIIKDKKVSVIIEIEESGFNPTKIFGKYFTSAFAKYYIHKTEGNSSIPISNKFLFIQILDSSRFSKKGSKKNIQCDAIEKNINDLIKKCNLSRGTYKLFLINDKVMHNYRKVMSQIIEVIKNFV